MLVLLNIPRRLAQSTFHLSFKSMLKSLRFRTSASIRMPVVVTDIIIPMQSKKKVIPMQKPELSSKTTRFDSNILGVILIRPSLCRQNSRPLSTSSRGDEKNSVSEFDDLHAINIHDGLSPLQRYSRIVAGTTGTFLATAALTGTSTVVTGMSLVAAGVSPETLFGIGCVCIPASFIGSLYHAYKLDAGKQSNAERIKHAFWLHGLMGVTISPSLLLFHQFIPHALITTGALVAGPITASRMMPEGAMLKWGPALYTGLWGLMGVGIASAVTPFFGFPSLGMALHNVDLYGGVVLFTVYNAYDTHVMIDEFNKGNKDYVGHAANYSLNALNLFIRLLEIFSKTSRSSSKST